jgi:hypothetical protein
VRDFKGELIYAEAGEGAFGRQVLTLGLGRRCCLGGNSRLSLEEIRGIINEQKGRRLMRYYRIDNFKFTSIYLWVAFLLSFPWFILTAAGLISPGSSRLIGSLMLLSGILSICMIIASTVEKEGQALFSFINAFLVIFNMVSQFVCVAINS